MSEANAMTVAVEAEMGLVSACLQYPERCFHPARQVVGLADVFTHPACAAIWQTMLEMDAAQIPTSDPILVEQRMVELGRLEGIGGKGKVLEMFTHVTVPGHFEFHLKTVLEKFYLRRLREVGQQIVELSETAGGDGLERPAAETVTEAESLVFSLLQDIEGRQQSSGPRKMAELLPEWVDKLETRIANRDKILGLTTGIHEIDLTVNGFDDRNGEIAVIAARPGQGKTSLARALIQAWGLREIPGVFFSAEENVDQVLNGLVLGAEGVDVGKAWTGHFSDEDKIATGRGVKKAMKYPVWINDSSRITTADLRIQTQVFKRRENIRWIMVDHLHLIKGVEKASAEERMRLVEVMETLQFLKKEHKIVVILLVQLNRETDRNAGKPPVLADLSGSAAIEWYADHVLFIHRPPYYREWDRLDEKTQHLWEDLVIPRRARCPHLWSDGRKYELPEGGAARQDYEEDAMIYWRKNRRGPTPELHIRFEGERKLFSSRMPGPQSNNKLDRQIGSYRPEPLKREGGGSGKKKWSNAKDDDGWDD